jgi:GT2 family glycosyltransferase
MPRTKISILLPAYADSPFLESCLISIREAIIPEQSNLIVILDRVSHRNAELIRTFESKIPKIIIKNSNFGLVNSLNLGIRESDSQFIARIDQDDWMGGRRLEKQLIFLRDNPDHVLVGSNVTLIDEGGKKIRESSYPLSNNSIRKVIFHRNVFAHPAVMYDRDAVVECGMYKHFYEGAEDYELWLRLIKLGKVANLQESLTFYRQHSDQMSTKNSHRQWIINEAVKASVRFNAKHNFSFDQNYNSIDEWYRGVILIRFKHKISMLKSHLISKFRNSE